jgi:hypothetical protein
MFFAREALRSQRQPLASAPTQNWRDGRAAPSSASLSDIGGVLAAKPSPSGSARCADCPQRCFAARDVATHSVSFVKTNSVVGRMNRAQPQPPMAKPSNALTANFRRDKARRS